MSAITDVLNQFKRLHLSGDGETGLPGRNHPETAGFISFFPNWEMLNFQEFINCFPIMSKCNFLREKHTVVVASAARNWTRVAGIEAVHVTITPTTLLNCIGPVAKSKKSTFWSLLIEAIHDKVYCHKVLAEQ